MMKARKVEIYLDKTKAYTFERSENNEIKEIAVVVDGTCWTIRCKKKKLKEWKCDGCIKQCRLSFQQDTDMSKFECILDIDNYRAMWVEVK